MLRSEVLFKNEAKTKLYDRKSSILGHLMCKGGLTEGVQVHCHGILFDHS